MIWRQKVSLAVLSTSLFAFAGCGHSEEEWQAKLKENQDLQTQLNAEKAAHQKAEADLDERFGAGHAAQRAAQEGGRRRLEPQLPTSPSRLAALEELQATRRAARGDPQALRAAQAEARGADQARPQRRRCATTAWSISAPRRRALRLGPRDAEEGRQGHPRQGRRGHPQRQRPDTRARSRSPATPTTSRSTGGRFKDNWGLSVMRAREVLSFLIALAPKEKGGGGGSPANWSAAGYGDTDPVAANDTPENTQKNRRCELVVLPNVEEMLDLKSLTK